MTSIMRHILKTDPKTADFLSRYLDSSGFKDLCDVEADEEIGGEVRIGPHCLAFPLRLGAVLDCLKQPQDKIPQNLNFVNGVLNIEDSSFSLHGKPEKIRLTEKEVAILAYLHDHRGESVSRADLLAAVWDYAQAVETHTLETHIYRLRQKIETDPSSPLNLLTDSNGYKVLG